MKRNVLRAAVLALILVLLSGCGKSDNGNRALERSDVWTLNSRYPVNYSSLTYIVTYQAQGEPFCLKASRNAKETGMSRRVKESRTVNGTVYTLCEGKKTDENGKALNTYYECYTGSFRYYIGRETDGFYIESILSMDDAIALIQKPTSPGSGIKFCDAEWNAQYRTDACNLEILIRPDDNGALVRELAATYQETAENGETYYTSSSGDDIAFSDGKHSVQIRQANRAGQSAPNYHTLSECKAILALLNAQ